MVIEPFMHSLCGDLSYIALFNDVAIDDLTDPMSYDMSDKEFGIYSEDFGLLGPNSIKIKGYLTSYNSVTSGEPIEA